MCSALIQQIWWVNRCLLCGSTTSSDLVGIVVWRGVLFINLSGQQGRQFSKLSLNMCIHSGIYLSKSHYKHYASRYLLFCAFTYIWNIVLWWVMQNRQHLSPPLRSLKRNFCSPWFWLSSRSAAGALSFVAHWMPLILSEIIYTENRSITRTRILCLKPHCYLTFCLPI